MADRSTKVQISAQVQGYIDGMEKAAKATREVGSETAKLAEQRMAFEMLGRSAVVMGAATAVGVGLAVSKWADFDQAMSNVQAATHSSEESMEQLADAALDAGARTVFSAEEAANAIEELAKAGVSTSDILNGALDGALDLAAAGGLGVAEAAGIAATALKTFKLEGSDMAHVADLLAAGAGKAMGDVTDLSAALSQGGLVAAQTGLSLEETAAALSSFASRGMLGSDAGTSLKTMLLALNPTSEKAAQVMQDLNLSAYDQQGKFIGLAEYAGKLETALGGMSAEQQSANLKTLFGNDAYRAAAILLAEGEQGIRDWTEAVDDQGYAAETAAARLDNLKGDIEALGGALDTALIKTGEGADGPLRGMVQLLTDAVDAYNELPAPLQSAALAAGILAAAIGILGGGLLLAIPKIAEFKIALSTLGVTGTTARTALMRVTGFLGGPWGIAMMAAAASVAVFNSSMDASKVSAQEFEMGLKQGAGALDVMRETAEKNEQGLVRVFADVGGQVDQLPALFDKAATSGRGFFSSLTFNESAMLDNIKEYGSALGDLAGSDLPRAQDEFSKFADSASLSREQLAVALDEMPAFRSALLDYADASGMATDDTALLALAMGELAPAGAAGSAGAKEQTNALEALSGVAADASTEVAQLADEIRNFGSEQFDVERSTAAFHQALADLNEQIASGSASLDVTTKAGRDTSAAMLDVASTTNEYAASVAAAGGSTEEVQAILESGRSKIVEVQLALGATTEAANAYADGLLATPEVVKTAVELAGVDSAEWQMSQLTRDRIARITVQQVGGMDVQVGSGALAWNPSGNENGGMYEKAFVREFMNGGILPGTIDSGFYQGEVHKFAETSLPWEAYISPKPDQRERNRGVWQATGDRLGFTGDITKAVETAVAASIGAMSGQGPSRVSNLTVINPVVRDLFQERWEANQESQFN